MDQGEDEDPPQLSAETLAALNQFYSEQKAKEETESPLFKEDWELSQFWYDEETTTFLADAVIKAIQGKGVIGCISCPTLYIRLLQVIKDHPADYEYLEVYLLEYDQRFTSLGPNFVHYDYRSPLAVKDSLEESFFDIIICDPPFLSEECLTRVTQTIRYLGKEKIILNTGTIMGELVDKLLQLKPNQSFVPRHRNNLANQFSCYTNVTL